jgi:hypothetical protein
MTRPYEFKPPPWEIDVFVAKDALRHGQERPLAIYLRDAAKGLRFLAELADPEAEGATPKLELLLATNEQAAENEGREDVAEEWGGSLHQLKQALDRGSTQGMGCYLRELSGVLEGLADTLRGRRERKLRFQRSRAGKPRDPEWQSVRRAIQTHLWLAKAHGVKQESTISDLKARYGLSRATIMRMNQAKRPKSQKKG